MTEAQSISIHALLAESDNARPDIHQPCVISIHALLAESDPERFGDTLEHLYFYPRSPCGERLYQANAVDQILPGFLSTLSLRRATDCQRPCGHPTRISIHALLAESDVNGIRLIKHISRNHFYPRSPCGERPGCQRPCERPTTYFYPRSPCGERPPRGGFCYLDNIISIHALLAESDGPRPAWLASRLDFYPRSPCGERPSFNGKA